MWYALQVMSGTEISTKILCRERISSEILQDIFFPEAEIMKRYQGSWHKLRRPMFPGYLFAITDDAEALLTACHQVPKLTKVLGTDKTPVALSDEEVTLLQRLINPDHIVEVSTGFLEGDQLLIHSGPMQAPCRAWKPRSSASTATSEQP